MGKTKLNSAPTSPEKTSAQLAPVPEHSYSNGELGQIQEILFGAQQRSTNEQISAIQSQFSEQIETLSNMLNSRINQLTETIDKTNKAHEQQLNDLKAEQNNSATSVSRAMLTQQQELESSIAKLGQSNGEETNRIHVELESVHAELQAQVRESHDSLQSQMNTSVELLQNSKLDKHSLANMLGGVSEQLATTDSTSFMTSSSDSKATSGKTQSASATGSKAAQ